MDRNTLVRGMRFIGAVRDEMPARCASLKIVIQIYEKAKIVQKRFLDAQHGRGYSQLVRCALDDRNYGDPQIAVTGAMYASAVAAIEILNTLGDNPTPTYKHNARDRRFMQYLVDNIKHQYRINMSAAQRFFAAELDLSRQAITNAVEARAERTIQRIGKELKAIENSCPQPMLAAAA